MSQSAQSDRRAVAKRVFDALCAQFPDKYIALIQPPDLDGEPLPPSARCRSRPFAPPAATNAEGGSKNTSAQNPSYLPLARTA